MYCYLYLSVNRSVLPCSVSCYIVNFSSLADRQPCSMSSPEYLEWEALTVFTESVMLRLFQSEKTLPDVSLGIGLLNQLLTYQNQVCLSAVEVWF